MQEIMSLSSKSETLKTFKTIIIIIIQIDLFSPQA